jgi:pimeloyl-ACP methyl ester carboxylesterase
VDDIPTPEQAVWADGPWEHRDVAANGARFHVAQMGEGPLVLMMHGFPMYWWTWRHLLPVLAEAGYRAVAMDLRGYGGSDHTPHGYDPNTLSADAAGVVRSLGESSAVMIGHGWGAMVAWAAAVMRLSAVRAIVPVSMPHPIPLRRGITGDAEQRRLSRYTLGYQWPLAPERALVKNNGAKVETILRDWGAAPGWPDEQTAAMYRAAIQFSSTAHCALEYHRWALRSIPRPDGRRFQQRMEFPVHQPVLHVLGAADGSILPRTSDGSERYVRGTYRRVDLPGVGHFPQEEAPERFAQILIPWLDGLNRSS